MFLVRILSILVFYSLELSFVIIGKIGKIRISKEINTLNSSSKNFYLKRITSFYVYLGGRMNLYWVYWFFVALNHLYLLWELSWGCWCINVNAMQCQHISISLLDAAHVIAKGFFIWIIYCNKLFLFTMVYYNIEINKYRTSNNGSTNG